MRICQRSNYNSKINGMSIIRFQPIYQERVWGGQDLKNILGRDIPGGHIGESWEIVDRAEANSVIEGGKWDGQTLREAIAEDAADIMGPDWDPDTAFPILVKWLDCQERLSLQVHPPASVAPELGGEPKTENWYIAAAKPEARLLAGLKDGVTRDAFEQALRAGELEPLVCALSCKEGDSLFVPSGRLHAIDAGNLILEIQQNSDTTYRVYDWGRVGLDGKPRELHIEESLQSIDFDDFEPALIDAEGGEAVLAESPEFRLRKLRLQESESVRIPAGEEPRIVSVVSGQLELPEEDPLPPSSNVLIPYANAVEFTATEASEILITDRFARR